MTSMSGAALLQRLISRTVQRSRVGYSMRVHLSYITDVTSSLVRQWVLLWCIIDIAVHVAMGAGLGRVECRELFWNGFTGPYWLWVGQHWQRVQYTSCQQ